MGAGRTGNLWLQHHQGNQYIYWELYTSNEYWKSEVDTGYLSKNYAEKYALMQRWVIIEPNPSPVSG